MDEHALSGGNMGGAVRVGSTVRKPSKPQSATIQRLLAHVRAQGVTWVPEPLGTDEQGRDVWSFIAGEVVEGYPFDSAGISSTHRGHSRVFKKAGFQQDGTRWARNLS